MDNKNLKAALFIGFFLAIGSLSSAFSDNAPVFRIGSGDYQVQFAAENPQSLLVYDEAGNLVDPSAAPAEIAEGWIIETSESPLEINSSGVGTIMLAPDTFAVLDYLREDGMELFVLYGKIRFLIETDRFPITIATPAGSYRIDDAGEYILAADEFEQFHVLSGRAAVRNLITGVEDNLTGLQSYSTLARTDSRKELSPDSAEALRKIVPLEFFPPPLASVEAEAAAAESLPVVIDAEPAEEEISVIEPRDFGIVSEADTQAAAVEAPPEIPVTLPEEVEPEAAVAEETEIPVLSPEMIAAGEPAPAVPEPDADAAAASLPEPPVPVTITGIDIPSELSAETDAAIEVVDEIAGSVADPAIKPSEPPAPVDLPQEPAVVPTEAAAETLPAEEMAVLPVPPVPEPEAEIAAAVEEEAVSLPDDETVVMAAAPAPPDEEILIIVDDEIAAAAEMDQPAETAVLPTPEIAAAPETVAVSTETLPEITAPGDMAAAPAEDQPEAAGEIFMAIRQPAASVTARPASFDASADDTKPFDFGIGISLGSAFPFGSTVYTNSFYLQTVLSPWFRAGRFTLGFETPLLFNINPFDTGDWLMPRGNNPYDFGTGYTTDILSLLNPAANFPASRDFYLDLLSLIGYVNYRSSGGAFRIHADATTPMSMGTGMLLSGLNPAIDAPYVSRVGLSGTLTTPYFSGKLVINDIGHADLYGIRMAVKPFGIRLPIELGLYGLSDISVAPENRFMIVPGIDLIYPITYTERLKLTAYADFALLMLADNSGFHLDSFYSDSSLYNYLAGGGLEGEIGAFNFAVSFAYENALLQQGLFGPDYQWRRMLLLEDLFDDNDYTLGKAMEGKWAVSADIGLSRDIFHLNFGYRFKFDEDFGVTWSGNDNLDELNLSMSLDTGMFTAELGFRQRSFAARLTQADSWNLRDYLFNDGTQFYTATAVHLGMLTIGAEFSGAAQYQNTASTTTMNNYDDPKLSGEGSLIIVPSLRVGATVRL